MYLSRVAADHTQTSRTESEVFRANAIPPISDVAAFIPRYDQHSDATLPGLQWAFGDSASFDLCIPVFISTANILPLLLHASCMGGALEYDPGVMSRAA